MDDHAGWLIGAADEEVADRGGVDGPGWAFEAGADIGGSELAGSDQDRDVMSGASQDVGSLVGGHHINSGSHVDHAPILGMIIEGFVVCFDVGLADSGEVVFVDDEEGAVFTFFAEDDEGCLAGLGGFGFGGEPEGTGGAAGSEFGFDVESIMCGIGFGAIVAAGGAGEDVTFGAEDGGVFTFGGFPGVAVGHGITMRPERALIQWVWAATPTVTV
jgi:hypothetical protein